MGVYLPLFRDQGTLLMFLWIFLPFLRLWFHQRSFTSRGLCLYLSNSLWWVSEVLHRTQSYFRARIYSSHFIPAPTSTYCCRLLVQSFETEAESVHQCPCPYGKPALPGSPSFLWSGTQLCLTRAMRVSEWFAPHISVSFCLLRHFAT